MLNHLHIENMAIFTEVDVTFGSGLNALTGETGAGKSIILDALGLALGTRSQRELVRTGENKAFVSALFDRLPAAVTNWLQNNGLDSDNEVQLSRELHADGRTVSRINGKVTTVGQLKALGQLILSVHGQHDSYQLLRSDTHLSYVDGIASNAHLRHEYAAAYLNWYTLVKERNTLQLSEEDKAARIELLRYHLAELERLDLQKGEHDELLTRRKLLRNAGKLADVAGDVRGALHGDDDTPGALAQLQQAALTLDTCDSLGDAWKQAAHKLHELYDELLDAGETALDLFGDNEFSEGELEQLESRLDAIARQEKRHGVSGDELVAKRAAIEAELDGLDFADMRLAELERAIHAAEEIVSHAALTLTTSRLAAAEQLKAAVERELADLDMGRVKFEAQLVPSGAYTPDGSESACFMIATNPGEPLKPLSKIASGGELARIMLALQNVLSDQDGISTLVFDEVDTGISGEAAQRVAEKMSSIARSKQVLCVTHLPQMAAFADTHLHVVKGLTEGRADTRVAILNDSERINEVGSLLGAGTTGQSAIDNARDLLLNATAWKQQNTYH